MSTRTIIVELRDHAPFTAFGALTGIVLMGAMLLTGTGHVSHEAFWTLHPAHVLLSAIATTAMFRRHAQANLWSTILVGYVGAVGIGTLSDCAIPFLGEWLLQLPHRQMHVGFIQMWWLVNPAALLGVAIALVYPKTKFPHAGHVLLSTWASLFHMTMAMDESVTLATFALTLVFLFIAVWIPCCASDIVFPLLFASTTSDPNTP
jgi:hypothetical protein